MIINVVSAGKSAEVTLPELFIKTFSGCELDGDDTYLTLINHAAIIESMTFALQELNLDVYGSCKRIILSAMDKVMIRQYADLFPGLPFELWTNKEQAQFASAVTPHLRYSTDLSQHGYGYTGTATLFEVLQQFSYADCINLYGFDMVEGAGVSKLDGKLPESDRWKQEREEFRGILQAFDVNGLAFNWHTEDGVISEYFGVFERLGDVL